MYYSISPNKLKLNINIVIILSPFFCCDVNIPCISAEISRLSLVHFTTELCLFLEVVHIYQDRHTHNTVVPAQIFLKKNNLVHCVHTVQLHKLYILKLFIENTV